MRNSMASQQLRFLILVLVGALTVGASACTADQAPEPAPPPPPAPAHNEADVTFLQDMIPHHVQAIEMARLTGERAAHDELKQLADTIIADQAREIDTMKGLLTAAEAPAPGDDKQGHGGMVGMASDSEMVRLRSLKGEKYDQRFIEMMTSHHSGAIDMSEQVLQRGKNPQVADLARKVIEAQKAEIEQMAAWEKAWTAL